MKGKKGLTKCTLDFILSHIVVVYTRIKQLLIEYQIKHNVSKVMSVSEC